MWKSLVPIAAFALLVAVFFKGLQLDPSEVPSPLIGKPAPAFDLPTLKDPAVRITAETLKGQVSLFNVWATWCVGCRQEHETLLAVARAGEVPIYGLNYKDDRVSALDWLQRLGDPYVENAFDAEGLVGIDWGVYGAPETFIIDKDGVVRYKHIGPLTGDIVRSRIMPLVKELGSN